MKINIKVDYTAKRAQSYPAIGEQLDAIWKALAANPSALPAEAADMLAKVQAVKSSIPKPKGSAK